MIKNFTAILLAALMVFSTGCASIVSKSNYPVVIDSTPTNAKITITDKKGVDVYRGSTPATIKLKSGNGFFSKAQYVVKFELDGYDTGMAPIEYKLDGWYFGNIIFGGFIGLLIVDPATGAMYKLDTEFINHKLYKSTASVLQEELKVYTLNDIPAEWKSHLVELSE
ncbi:hypothetical protein GGR28_002297 [Lewinella aquimaris]|uniref:PEGA domain-containing protein n=1 Tax=Neolewinella aquimaris TaxID=1835722 RepID=A0A840E7G1_9BACT|nr:hypothetical protein [Neolewinella aquimaris]MBB4079672.1 hypothetical protein [Neolewinella aquimaris]